MWKVLKRTFSAIVLLIVVFLKSLVFYEKALPLFPFYQAPRNAKKLAFHASCMLVYVHLARQQGHDWLKKTSVGKINI